MELNKQLKKVGYYDRIEFCRFVYEFYSNLNNSGIRDDEVNIIDMKFYGNERYDKVVGQIYLDNGAKFYLDVNMDFYWIFEYKNKEFRFEEYHDCWEFICEKTE